MGSITDRLIQEQLLNSPPSHLKHNVQYECMMGSVAYGVSTDTSDTDVYGFSIPNKDIIFPHMFGYISGFGKNPLNFKQFQQHHIAFNNKEYDISIYSIIRFFQLCMDNNPNMIDSLFVPRRCVLHVTQIGELVRENRKMFLHKGSWQKFKGYAFSQVHKMKSKAIKEFVAFCDMWDLDYQISLDDGIELLKSKIKQHPEENIKTFKKLIKLVDQSGKRSKRIKTIAEFGFDVKFGYHVVRLLDEVEQILTEHDIDLERNREQLKAIRRGEWSENRIIEHFETKEKDLESLYTKSELQHSPDIDDIRQLLLKCLEMHFGSLEKCIMPETDIHKVLTEMQEVINRYRK